MEFNEILNEYMDELQCSAKALSEASGLSEATISRYRSGERIPEAGSDNLAAMIKGLAAIAADCSAAAESDAASGRIRTPNLGETAGGLTADVSAEAITARFTEAAGFDAFDMDKFRVNLNVLCSTLSMSTADFARSMRYDPSHISRIKNGQRRPSDPSKFAEETARYIARTYSKADDRATVASLIGCDASALGNSAAYADLVYRWLTSGTAAMQNEVADYLMKINDFDLNEYIKAIHFDTLKVPSVPFQFATSKTAHNIKEMMEIELDFIKATVLSKSSEELICYSDMPMEEMGRDKDFPKKWMYGMALMLKKGLHINIIHDINRPFSEMMLGLESFIPLYMTGQISPYYISSPQNNVFLHFLKVSGTAALTGEAIVGHHSEGQYYLTKKEEEVKYYKRRAKRLLANASPLMTIYDKSSAAAYNAFLNSDVQTSGRRRRLNSSLPLFTATDQLLAQILTRSSVPQDDQAMILCCAAEQRSRLTQIMEHDVMTDEIAIASEADFSARPLALSLADAFYENDVFYTYDEYLQHLQLTREYAETHENYELKLLSSAAFHNIQICMHEGRWAVVSKDKSPCIHFMIFHPKMRNAIENMVIPIIED